MTGVQTCALPISGAHGDRDGAHAAAAAAGGNHRGAEDRALRQAGGSGSGRGPKGYNCAAAMITAKVRAHISKMPTGEWVTLFHVPGWWTMIQCGTWEDAMKQACLFLPVIQASIWKVIPE